MRTSSSVARASASAPPTVSSTISRCSIPPTWVSSTDRVSSWPLCGSWVRTYSTDPLECTAASPAGAGDRFPRPGAGRIGGPPAGFAAAGPGGPSFAVTHCDEPAEPVGVHNCAVTPSPRSRLASCCAESAPSSCSARATRSVSRVRRSECRRAASAASTATNRPVKSSPSRARTASTTRPRSDSGRRSPPGQRIMAAARSRGRGRCGSAATRAARSCGAARSREPRQG